MALYEPLGQYLKANGSGWIAMTFREVETVLGRKLPKSAYGHRAWWANENRGHSHAKAWLGAGYETEQVDMAAKKLVFRRVSRTMPHSGMEESPRMFEQETQPEKKQGRYPLIGALIGTFTIEPGWDLTGPVYTPEEWAQIEKEMEEDRDQIEQGMSKKRTGRFCSTPVPRSGLLQTGFRKRRWTRFRMRAMPAFRPMSRQSRPGKSAISPARENSNPASRRGDGSSG